MASNAQDTPALAPPPGVTPNFNNPESLWKYNIVAQIVCLSLAGIAFLLRVYVRSGLGKVARQWIVEDWMVCFSFIGLVVYGSLLSVQMNHQGGVHQWNLTVKQAQLILYYFWIESVLYGIFIFFTKCSILLMYTRFFVPRRASLMWAMVYGCLVVSGMFYTSITLVKIWECQPRERIWNKNRPGKCIDLGTLLMVSGCYNTISDTLILVIPVKAVWNLKMSFQKKLGVCLVFTIGAVAPVFSIIGFIVRFRAGSSKDATHNQPLILLWSLAEVTSGVLCACLPTLPTLIRGRNRSQAHSSDSGNSNSLTKTFRGRGEKSEGVYLELEEYHSQIRELSRPNRAVCTDISGGTRFDSSQMSRSVEDIEECDRSDLDYRHGIVRTVEIEQRND